MVNQIFLRQIVEEIEKTDEKGNAIPFDVEFWTFNRNNKSGGAVKKYKGAKLLIRKKLKGKAFVESEHEFRPIRNRKNPKHWENATRNIETASGQIRKLHIRLIKKFNGLEMIY